MQSRYYLFILIFGIVCFPVFALDLPEGVPSFGMQAYGGYDAPIGSSGTFFEPGYSGSLFLGYKPDIALPLMFTGEFEYGVNPVDEVRNLNRMTGALGGGINLRLLPFLGLNIYTMGGYSFCTLTSDEGDTQTGAFFIHALAGPEFYITPALGITIQAGYKNFLGLYQGFGVSAGVSYYIGKAHRRPPAQLPVTPQPLTASGPTEGNLLEMKEIDFEFVFPVFYSYYDDHPVGSAVLYNPTDEVITDISVSLLVKQYMDAPKECVVPSVLEPGQSEPIDLIALFTNAVLEITEGTKVASEITLSYKQGDTKYQDIKTETIQMHYRNAMTWDDDRKAAAFVTAKDPAVMAFSKNIVSMIQRDSARAVDRNLQMAIGIHEALGLYGMSYVIDPTTPYADFSKQEAAVDFLQFPRETLEYRAGDCDDLSILYSALFESVGIEPAFVTVPGHIFIAFALDMSPDEARKTFSRSDELIFREDKAWVPLEITELEEGFLIAWQTGAKEWRENSARDQAGFFPVREAWQYYRPVGLPGGGKELKLPSEERILEIFDDRVTRFIDREIFPQVAKLEADIERTGGSVKYINKLGVLYARYGLYQRAVTEFEKILEQREHVPTLINIGNIHFIEKAMENALEYYERAEENAPDNPKVVLAVARANHELENYGAVRKNYEKLQTLDPSLALQFGYLDLRGEEGARAAELSAVADLVLWEEEE